MGGVLAQRSIHLEVGHEYAKESGHGRYLVALSLLHEEGVAGKDDEDHERDEEKVGGSPPALLAESAASAATVGIALAAGRAERALVPQSALASVGDDVSILRVKGWRLARLLVGAGVEDGGVGNLSSEVGAPEALLEGEEAALAEDALERTGRTLCGPRETIDAKVGTRRAPVPYVRGGAQRRVREIGLSVSSSYLAITIPSRSLESRLTASFLFDRCTD